MQALLELSEQIRALVYEDLEGDELWAEGLKDAVYLFARREVERMLKPGALDDPNPNIQHAVKSWTESNCRRCAKLLIEFLNHEAFYR